MQINPPQDDPHFKLIQDEFMKQKQANVQFDQRISKAKYTTNKIDTNVDRISEILNHNSNESPPRSKKAPHTSESMLCDQENIPGPSVTLQPYRELYKP